MRAILLLVLARELRESSGVRDGGVKGRLNEINRESRRFIPANNFPKRSRRLVSGARLRTYS